MISFQDYYTQFWCVISVLVKRVPSELKNLLGAYGKEFLIT